MFDWQKAMPWTNNPTDQELAEARTVRGYKTWPGMSSSLMVAGIGIA
jgi:hypothetical protein